MLGRRATQVLAEMIAADSRGDHDDAEITCDGECWVGLTRISRRTVDDLLLHLAVRDVSEGGGIERYVVGGTGRAIHEDPAVADRVLAAIQAGGAFDERGRPLDDGDAG